MTRSKKSARRTTNSFVPSERGREDDDVTRKFNELMRTIVELFFTRTNESHEKMEAFATAEMTGRYVTKYVDIKLAELAIVDDFKWK